MTYFYNTLVSLSTTQVLIRLTVVGARNCRFGGGEARAAVFFRVTGVSTAADVMTGRGVATGFGAIPPACSSAQLCCESLLPRSLAAS